MDWICCSHQFDYSSGCSILFLVQDNQFLGIAQGFRNYFLSYFVIDFSISFAVPIDGALFPIIVVFDATTTLANKLINFCPLFGSYLLFFMLEWREAKAF